FQLCAAVLLGAGLVRAQSVPALTLEQLIDIGLDNNSDIRIAERDLMGARADRRGSFAGLVPSVNMSGSINLEDLYSLGPVEFPAPALSSRISLSQTLFDGARSWYDARSGATSVRSSIASFESIQQQAVLTIKQAYYNLLSASELLEVADEALALSRRQLELVEERFRLQAVKETDLLKARVSMGQREADRYQARQNVATAMTSLNVAIGQEPSSPVNVARDSLVLKPVPERESALSSLRANNPELKVRALAVDQAWLRAKRQRGVMLPSVSVSYGGNYRADELGDLFSSDNRITTSSLNISLPLFSGLQNTSRYSSERYNALAEEERFDGRMRDLKSQLENTLSKLESLHSIHPIYQEVLASAEADVRLANEQYNLGAISILDLLDAQVSLITARSTLVRTTYDIKIAEAQLEALMGTIGQ
ncbi:MAG: TolC family protein, partial [Candidatus Neomarinimicrobiota bacterium]